MGGVLEYLTFSWQFMVAAFGPLGPFFAIGIVGTLLIAMSVPVLLRKPVDPLDKLNTRGVRGGPIRAPGGADKTDTVRLRYDSGTVNLDKFAGDPPQAGSGRLSRPLCCLHLPPRTLPFGHRLPVVWRAFRLYAQRNPRHELRDDVRRHPRRCGLLPANLLDQTPHSGPPGRHHQRLPGCARPHARLCGGWSVS